MFGIEQLIEIVKVLISVGLFFVWVVRYNNIVEEFKIYNLPDWVRDSVGIFKLTCAFLLQSSQIELVIFSNITLILLMLIAIMTHLRIKNTLQNMIPAIAMISMNIFVLMNTL